MGRILVRFEVFMAVKVHIKVFWIVMRCSVVPCILKLGTRGKLVVSFMTWSFTTGEKTLVPSG
jgi:hypothetical protein